MQDRRTGGQKRGQEDTRRRNMRDRTGKRDGREEKQDRKEGHEDKKIVVVTGKTQRSREV